MRFKLDFKIQGERPFAMPAYYQNELSSWMYKMLHFGSKDFNKWLSDKGYLDQQGEYWLYTFSDMEFGGIKHQDDRLIIEEDSASMIISFYAEETIQKYILEIFQNHEFKIGDSKSKVAFKIANIVAMNEPDFSKGIIKFSCISPMLISQPGIYDGSYYNPDKKEFSKIFFKNLMFKYASLVKFIPDNNSGGLTNLGDLQFQLMGKPRSKIIKISSDTPHQKTVKGYLFNFSLKAPETLLRIGYQSGFGDLNNLGFGCCKVL